ncbi:MAG: hypothetical protein QXU32_04945 [Nitrososphaerales archaeon]
MKFHITIVCESAEELKLFTDSVEIKEKSQVLRKMDEQVKELQDRIQELENHAEELRQLR